MCGLAGQLLLDPRASPDEAAVRAMGDAQRHRGPDGEGIFRDGPLALGHRRLSIIDLLGGAQPLANEDGSVVVAFNGEIYNYRELVPDLESKGHRFRTHSDTEVLVHLYEELGDRMVEPLVGMFAFALWDGRKKRLLAARDRFGEKPFVWAVRNGSLLFASEIGALMRHPLLAGAELDREALELYLSLLYIPAPRTIFRGVQKLPQGHLLVAEGGSVRTERYFRPPRPGALRPAMDEVRAELSRRLDDAVRLRMRSDVPVGALLSGGLDSSAVVLHMARHAPRVHTFTVDFGDGASEGVHARAVAEAVGAEHHELRVEMDVVGATRRAAAMFGEPFGDTSSVPTLLVCEAASRHVKVLLTGDGGDELFAGYGRYRTFPFLRLLSLCPAPLLRAASRAAPQKAALALRLAALPDAESLVEWLSIFRADDRQRLLGAAPGAVERLVENDYSGLAGSALPLAFDAGVYLPEDLLVKVDVASMQSSVECRAPLLDHRLAEWAMAIDPCLRLAGESKHLLRDYLREALPAGLADRPKQGFGAPVDRWLRGPLRELSREALGPSAPVWDLVDGAAGQSMIEGYFAGRRRNPYQPWSLLMLALWQEGRL